MLKVFLGTRGNCFSYSNGKVKSNIYDVRLEDLVNLWVRFHFWLPSKADLILSTGFTVVHFIR